MPGETKLGDEYLAFIDIDHDGGGVWTTPDWQQLVTAGDITDDPGLIVAEMNFRGFAHVGGRRSTRRKPALSITVGVYHGDPAFDRLYEAATAEVNDGSEIVRLRIADGLLTETGHKYNDNDWIVASMPRATPQGGVYAFTFGFVRAIDSPNAPAKGTTSGA
jgi:hypothetical protein